MLKKLKKEILKDIMKISGIYKIVNKVNGKYYIGSTTQLTNHHGRWYKHKRRLINNNHINLHLQSAWNKYGENNFEFVIIEKVSKERLIETEQKYLNKACLEKDKCYNLSFIADRPEMTDEIKRKISNSNKGRIFSINNLNKLIKNNKLNPPFLGKHHSNQTKLKLSSIWKGKKRPKYIIDKIKNKCSGHNHSQYNKTIYTFRNQYTNEIFTGTRFDFRIKYSLYHSSVWMLVNNKIKQTNGWILF